ncbi:MAG: alkaline phosphatase family protein [Ginsengibacter sp.]
MKKFIFIVLVLFYAETGVTQISPAHTVIVIIENTSYNQIVGGIAAPYINELLANTHTASLSQSFGLTHPSQPNYLMLFSGSNQDVTDDFVPKNIPFTTPNLGAEIIKKGLSFIGYSEDMANTGSTDSIFYGYVRKHNPWVNWQESSINGIPTISNRLFNDFPSDYNMLPTVSFVVPNLYHDMHDGSITDGDTWLRNNLDGYIQWCINNNSLFILTTDEQDGQAPANIVTFFTGANIKGGIYNQSITHYNVLRTIEELYQLPYVGESINSSAISSIWLTVLPLQLLKFDVTLNVNYVNINWEVTGEFDTKLFTIERSTDNGRSFKSIGTMNTKGSGNTINKYQFIDHEPITGINLYRLKQFDFDNKIQYSKTVSVVLPQKKVSFSIYPNPVHNFTNIFSNSSESKDISIQLVNAEGKIVKQYSDQINYNHPIKFNLDGISKGIYFIRLLSDDEITTNKILVK